jgi:hypothetical protein
VSLRDTKKASAVFYEVSDIAGRIKTQIALILFSFVSAMFSSRFAHH